MPAVRLGQINEAIAAAKLTPSRIYVGVKDAMIVTRRGEAISTKMAKSIFLNFVISVVRHRMQRCVPAPAQQFVW